MDKPSWITMFERDTSNGRGPDCSPGSRAYNNRLPYINDGQTVENSLYDKQSVRNPDIFSRPLPAIPQEDSQYRDDIQVPIRVKKTPAKKAKETRSSKVTTNSNDCKKSHGRNHHRRKHVPADDTNSESRVPSNGLHVTFNTDCVQPSNEAQNYYENNHVCHLPNYVNVHVLPDRRRERQRTLTTERLSSVTSDDSLTSAQSSSPFFNNFPRKKRKRWTCIVSMVALILLIVAGLFAAVYFVLIMPNSESQVQEATQNKVGYEMLVGVVKLRIVNQSYHMDMNNTGSDKFAHIQNPLCRQMDITYLSSNLTQYYYGCNVVQLSEGSIRVLQDLLFQTSAINPTYVKHLITSRSPVYNWKGIPTLRLGSFMVDKDSISVDIVSRKYESLPLKPLYPVDEFSDADNSFFHEEDFQLKTTRKTSTTSQNTSPKKHFVHTANVHLKPEVELTTATTTTSLTSTIARPLQLPEIGFMRPLGPTIHQEKPSESFSQLKSTSVVDTKGPYVMMANQGTPSSGGSVAIQCSVVGLSQWSYLVVSHIREGFPETPLINVTSQGLVSFPDGGFRNPSRLIVSMKLERTLASVSMNFTSLDCRDEGIYSCVAHGGAKLITGRGYLSVKAKPSKPELVLPDGIVEDVETRSPLICRANVGYPPGKLIWEVKAKGHNNYIFLNIKNRLVEGHCQNIVTSSFKYTPAMEGNDTTIRCRVENSLTAVDDDFSTSALIRVIPKNLCKDKRRGTTIAHPYECNKYVRCLDTATVFRCPEDLCFNPNTMECGQTGLFLPNAVANLNEGLASMSCRLLHLGSWSSLKIYRIFPNGKKMLLMTANEVTNVTIAESSIQDRLFGVLDKAKYSAELKFWIYSLECADEGMYACEAEAPFIINETYGKLALKVKPEMPKINSPTEIISGRPLREKFVCKGNVGYPGGSMKWQIRMKPGDPFQEISSTEFNATSSENSSSCSRTITNTLSFLPLEKYSGRMLRCVVQNNYSLSNDQMLWSSIDIHVIPSDFCAGHGTDTLPHPRSCNLYIQCLQGYMYVQRCSSGLCFNPKTNQCDIPEPVQNVTFNPREPCRPNKNGEYFPHPFLCNKYYWCVQGREVTQHCPAGTLYLGNGQCTYNANESKCYKEKHNNRKR